MRLGQLQPRLHTHTPRVRPSESALPATVEQLMPPPQSIIGTTPYLYQVALCSTQSMGALRTQPITTLMRVKLDWSSDFHSHTQHSAMRSIISQLGSRLTARASWHATQTKQRYYIPKLAMKLSGGAPVAASIFPRSDPATHDSKQCAAWRTGWCASQKTLPPPHAVAAISADISADSADWSELSRRTGQHVPQKHTFISPYAQHNTHHVCGCIHRG
jgi:hypothetical protein